MAFKYAIRWEVSTPTGSRNALIGTYDTQRDAEGRVEFEIDQSGKSGWDSFSCKSPDCSGVVGITSLYDGYEYEEFRITRIDP